MSPATLLRAVAAVALVVAAALSAAPSSSARSPPATTAQPVRNEKDEANNHFSIDSKARVASHGSSTDSHTASDRLSGWPMTVLEKVRDFQQAGHAWQPHAIAALRAEVIAMRELMYSASGLFNGGTGAIVPDDAWETAPRATGFPGAENFPGADIWPGEAGWPGGFSEDVWQLSAVEFLHHGLLKVDPVESIHEAPVEPMGMDGYTRVAARLWGRRKARMDQIKLRRDGAFGQLLPAATVAGCFRLIQLDGKDVREAHKKLNKHSTTGANVETEKAIESLLLFVDKGIIRQAVQYFNDTIVQIGARTGALVLGKGGEGEVSAEMRHLAI